MSDMDIDGDGSVTIEEAIQFVWGEVFPDSDLKAEGRETEDHVRQLFIDMDADLDRNCTLTEFLLFFERLKTSGQSEAGIIASCEAIIENGRWDAWKKNRRNENVRAWEFEPSEFPAIGVVSCSASAPQVSRVRVSILWLSAHRTRSCCFSDVLRLRARVRPRTTGTRRPLLPSHMHYPIPRVT